MAGWDTERGSAYERPRRTTCRRVEAGRRLGRVDAAYSWCFAWSDSQVVLNHATTSG
jgi:hypothetical protein